VPQISGANGNWDYTIGSGNPEQIDITFTPKNTVVCKRIYLLQTAKKIAYDAVVGGNEVPGPPEDWWTNGYPYGHAKPDRVTDPDGHVVYIDHTKCEADPYYNGDDDPNDKPRSAGSGPDGTGTTMTDGPGTPFDNKVAKVKRIVTIFETCAICADDGQILGCISWSSEATRGGSDGKISVTPPDKETTVSETFKKALKKFCENHTKKGTDGKLHWWCPEKAPGVKGPKGDTADPFGPEVPDGFKKRWLAVETTTPLKLDRASVGGGLRLADTASVFALSMSDVTRSAIKFTWAAEQEKPIGSVIFSALDLTEADVAPYVENSSQFANDFIVINHCHTTPEFISDLLHHLAEASDLLKQQDGPTVVTILAALRSERAASFSGTLDRIQVSAIMERAALHSGVEGSTLKVIQYIALNMGALN
jgi:hypothetical protein